MKRLLLSFSFILGFMLNTSLIQAIESDDTTGFEIAGGFGKFFYKDSSLNNPNISVLNLSYRLNKDYQVELMWADPDTQEKISLAPIDVDWGTLRGLYYMGHGKVSPYLALGVSNTDVYQGKYSANVGLGIRYDFNKDFFMRFEENFVRDDIAIAALFGFRFGARTPAPPAPKDSDGDGVMDNVDACRNTPIGNKVDHTGCTIKIRKDTDDDGIFDEDDKCPNTPKNALVDGTGCQQVLTKEVSVDLNINFSSNKADVSSEYLSEIASVAKFMTQYAGTSVVIEGHTDSQGKAAYNQILSAKRAAAVASILVEQYNIDASRVKSVGYGEDNAIADNSTAEGRQQNRRVVAVINQQVTEKQWQ